MEQFETILANTRRRDAFYREQLSGIEGVKFQSVDDCVNANCWLFTFRTKRKSELIEHLASNNIQARPFWKPMNQLPMFAESTYVTEYDVAQKVYQQAVSIPSSTGITDQELQTVASSIKALL